MDYKVFLETIRQALQERLQKDLQLIIRPVPKNNGILLDGLSIQSLDSCLAPTVYLNPYYTLYQEGMSIDAICSDILGLFQNSFSPDFVNDNIFNHFEDQNPLGEKNSRRSTLRPTVPARPEQVCLSVSG